MPTGTLAELSRLNYWIHNVLSSDQQIFLFCGGRIYADEAPQNALTPMVIFAFLGGSDRTVTTASTRLSYAIYLIRAIAESSSYDTVALAADRIEALLTVPSQGTVINSEVRITSCLRQQPHQRKDSSNGIPTVYMGGFYGITFQLASQ